MSKTVLITGSSSGIGRATAKLFHEKGWNVVATMRTPENENELTNLSNVLVTRLDVQDLKSIKDSFSQALTRFGKIDVVVNNAGYGAYGVLEATPREKIVRQFEVNVLGLFDVTKEALPHFRETKGGIFINISSIGGKMTFPLGSLYHGSKFAVEGLSEALHYELEEIGAKVKIVEPGIIDTDFGSRSLDLSFDANLVEYQNLVQKLQEAQTSGGGQSSSPDVVANVIFNAATDGSNQLRYTAGEDAKFIVQNRKTLDDEEFMNGIKAQFGLSTIENTTEN